MIVSIWRVEEDGDSRREALGDFVACGEVLHVASVAGALALASSISVWSYDCEEAAERLGPVVPSPLGFILTAPHVPGSITFCVR